MSEQAKQGPARAEPKDDQAAEISRLKAELAEARAQAQAAQAVAGLSGQASGSVSVRTTTTKPTYRFRVTCVNAKDETKRQPVEVDVVDESEAIRFVATKLGIAPSDHNWQVVCVDPKRAASLTQHDALRQKLYPATLPAVMAGAAG